MCIWNAAGFKCSSSLVWSASIHMQSEEEGRCELYSSSNHMILRCLFVKPGNRLTRRMPIIANEYMGIVSGPPTRSSHIAQPPTHLPIRPRLRYIRNTNRIRSGKELQIRSLLARALVLVNDYVDVAAGLDMRSMVPV